MVSRTEGLREFPSGTVSFQLLRFHATVDVTPLLREPFTILDKASLSSSSLHVCRHVGSLTRFGPLHARFNGIIRFVFIKLLVTALYNSTLDSRPTRFLSEVSGIVALLPCIVFRGQNIQVQQSRTLDATLLLLAVVLFPHSVRTLSASGPFATK